MMGTSWWFSWSICALLTSVAVSMKLTYDDPHIRVLNCFPADSCRNKKIENAVRDVRLLEDFDKRSCYCDDRCIEFGDCCVDADTLVERDDHKPITNGQVCTELKNYGGVYMVDKCPTDWQDDGIKENCEGSEHGSKFNPMSTIPVTDTQNGTTTYRNFYCAVCNGHSQPGQVQLWQSRIQCYSSPRRKGKKDPVVGNITLDFIRENIYYNDTVNYWGIMRGTRFVRCDIDPFMPGNLSHKIRRCRVALADCSPEWKDEDVRQKCHHYEGTVVLYDNHDNSFKNVHCAICNGFYPQNVSCAAPSTGIKSRHNSMDSFEITPFALLLDFNSNDGQFVGSVSRCGENEIFDPFFKVCRNVVCGRNDYIYQNGRCAEQVKETTMIPSIQFDSRSGFSNHSVHEKTVVNNTSTSTISPENGTEIVFDKSFLECPKWNVHEKNVLWLMNGSIYIKTYDRIFNARQFQDVVGPGVLICALNLSPEETKFSSQMAIVSFIGLGISLTCLVLHFIAFLIVPDLQNLSGKNLSSLVLALFAGYLTFILGMFSEPNSLSCSVIAVVTYYSFLSSFFWMNVISFDVWQTLKMATTELRVSGGKQLTKFVLYSFYAWLFPGIFMTVGLLMDHNFIPSPELYRPGFGTRNCWFGHRLALAVFFGGPTGILLVFNIIFFVLSTFIIVWSTRNSSKLVSPNNSPRRNYKLYLRLAVICGLTWIWGFLAGFFNLEPLWYIFIFFNTLMGLFIFLTFTCVKKVRLSLKDRMKCLTKTTQKNEMFNISASSASNLNSNDTRKSTLIPTDSGGSNGSDGYGGTYNPLASYKASTTTLY